LTIDRPVCIKTSWDARKPPPTPAAASSETADRLFYAEGVRAVGIDPIIAESGVAKMTLYSHFPGKDELILAVLWCREEHFMVWFGRAMGRHVGAGEHQLGALVESLSCGIVIQTCLYSFEAIERRDPCSSS
jgi:AcrR family transcriptional regulator